jgi:hypothetical protein
MELLAVFAAQATAAITATRVQSGAARLMTHILEHVGDGTLTEEQVDAIVSDATRDLDDHADTPFWHLVDHVEALRTLGERDLTLVADILNVVARHAERAPRRR